jgi:hypothetical protein
VRAAPDGRRRSRSRGWCWSAVLAVTVALAPRPSAAAPATTKTVVVMGDSLVAEAVGDLTADLHGAGWHVDATGAVPGAGLLDTRVSWLATAKALVARDHPAAAVVEYVGNFGVYGAPAGVTAYSPRFYALWDRAAQRLEDALAAGGATVYWVIGPPVAPRQNEAGIVVFDKQYALLHAPDTASGHPPLIDVTPALTGGTGRYGASVPGPGGRIVRVRRADGVQLTADGKALFAAVVARAVE